ncbi:hypothetical protein [Streptomyces sp. NPDC086787]|uniref:hypothetical protein n=1 Tax=Streptomyces sp. NPDC086787 TaxID=3365759 RepID=UPI0037F54126
MSVTARAGAVMRMANLCLALTISFFLELRAMNAPVIYMESGCTGVVSYPIWREIVARCPGLALTTCYRPVDDQEHSTPAADVAYPDHRFRGCILVGGRDDAGLLRAFVAQADDSGHTVS